MFCDFDSPRFFLKGRAGYDRVSEGLEAVPFPFRQSLSPAVRRRSSPPPSAVDKLTDELSVLEKGERGRGEGESQLQS